jgi:hypothetical protein
MSLETLVIIESCILVVEGSDDERLFLKLVSMHQLPAMQIIAAEGADRLVRDMQLLPKTSGFGSVTRLIVVRDCDSCATSSFQSVADALHRAGLPAPVAPWTWSPEVEGLPLRTAVLTIPNAYDPGMIEDLCMQSVVGQEAADRSIAFVDDMGSKDLIAGPQPKAKAHVYIATQRKPDVSLGVAAQSGYFDLGHEAFAGLVAFLLSIP